MLTSKEQIKEILGNTAPTGTGSDALLDKLAAAAHAFVVSLIGYDPELSSYAETRNGNGNYSLALDVPHLVSVESLRIDGRIIDAAESATAYGYVLDKRLSIIHLRGFVFTRGLQNVAINYTAGFAADALPADLTMAATEIAVAKYKTKDTLGIQSKTLAQETITFTDKAMPNSARDVINDYKRMYLTS